MPMSLRSNKWIRICAVLPRVLIIFMLVGLMPGVFRAAGAEVVDRIMAVVNDDIITLSDFNEMYAPYAEKIKAYGYPEDKEREMLFELRNRILDQLIDKKLTEQEIERLSISVSEKEVDDNIERIKEQNFFTDEELRDRLKKEGYTLAQYRSEMREQIQRMKLVEMSVKSKIVITDEDIRDYYESHAESYAVEERYHIRNIIMRVSPGALPEEKEAVLARMRLVMEKLESGADFSELAREYSEASMAEQGGDLGFFKKSDLAEQIRIALKGLKPGEHTAIMDTDQGYQIFYLESVSPAAGKSFEEVKSSIEKKLYEEKVNEKFTAWVSDLREKSHIKKIQ